jgi:hypothetical protein
MASDTGRSVSGAQFSCRLIANRGQRPVPFVGFSVAEDAREQKLREIELLQNL